MVANLNSFRALPNTDSLVQIELETKLGIFFFGHIDKYESMENADVRTDICLKMVYREKDIQSLKNDAVKSG